MSTSSESIRLELSVNGQRVGTGGTGPYGVLSLMLTWVRRDPDEIPEHLLEDPEFDRDVWLREELDVNLGGMERDEHVDWVQEHPLKIGDEVTIRVLPPGPIDAPTRRPRTPPAT